MSVAVVVDLGILAVTAYAHIALTRVRLGVVVESEIVQVFVDCRLAHEAYTQAQELTPLDLGWLDRGDIVTVEVRGRQAPGYYEVQAIRDSHVEVVGKAGEYGRRLPMASGRVVFVRSFTVGGMSIGGLGCQPDSNELALAASAARRPGKWRDAGLRNTVIRLAERLAPFVPQTLGLLAALALIALAVIGRVNARSKTLLRTAGATLDVVLALVLTLAGRDLNLAFDLCVALGVVSLLVLVWLLMAPDIGRNARAQSRSMCLHVADGPLK